MKRELKFRVWNGAQMISPDYIDRKGFAHWKENSIPETSDKVMQFIGLKDNNGIDLYEGDIIEFMFFTYNGTEVEDLKKGVIVIDELGVLFQTSEGADYLCWLDFDSESQIEIIGNIHQNPELL
jgi:uncharacterized phage protein (TIGR01671 family)